MSDSDEDTRNDSENSCSPKVGFQPLFDSLLNPKRNKGVSSLSSLLPDLKCIDQFDEPTPTSISDNVAGAKAVSGKIADERLQGTYLPLKDGCKMEMSRCKPSSSPVEVKVYDDRQQMVLDKHTADISNSQIMHPTYDHQMEEMGNNYSPSSQCKYSHLYNSDRMYPARKGYHPYSHISFTQPFYQYSVMPSGNPARVQTTMRQSRMRPSIRRSPASLSPATSQMLPPHSPSPISSPFLSPNTALTNWSHAAVAAASEWGRMNRCAPTSHILNPNPLAPISRFMSPPTNGYSDSQWNFRAEQQQQHPCCSHFNSYPKPNSHFGSPYSSPSGCKGIQSHYPNHFTTGTQTKKQDEYAQTLQSLCDVLKSDVFMGYARGSERYGLFDDDRPVSPLKLLEIDSSLDWSDELPFKYVEIEPKGNEDEVVLRSIRQISDALTRN